MRVIDAHVHLYPPEAGRGPIAWAAANDENHWATLCTRRRKNGGLVQGFPTVEQLLSEMDAAGIFRAVLLGWYWENHATCVIQNNFYIECVRRYPDRLAAFATVHASAGTMAMEELRRAKGNGLIGLGELSPHSQGIALRDPWWIELLGLAAQLQFPINLHVTDPHSTPYLGRVETPLVDFLRMAREFPQNRFILAHWGGGLAFDSACHTLKNVYFDTAASPLIYGPEAWARGANTVLDEHVLFGSDYPLVLYPKAESAPGFSGILGEIKSTGLAEAKKAEILSGSASKLFGW